MREYTILVGKSTHDLWNAMIKNMADPSEENKKQLELLENENTQRLEKWQKQGEAKFAELYGEEMLAFIKTLPNREYFLINDISLLSLNWDIKSDENDDYWYINFYKGEFSYRVSHAGGYAGVETLEKNITKERVRELLNIKN